MIALIILLKEQKKYLHGIVSALDAQTIKPDMVVLAVDRCADDYTEAQCVAREQNWLAVHANVGMDDAGVLIGRTRNAALAVVPEDYHVIFTDGDCVPSTRFIEHHAAYLDSRIPTATTGCRFAQTEAGEWVEDIRITTLPYRSMFSKENDRLILGNAAESTHILFGCNMGMNSAAVKLIRDRSAEVLGERTVFASVFDGEWGYEETSICPVLYDAGARIVALSPNTSSVKHYWHPSRGAGVRGSAASADYLRKMRKPSITITRDGTSKKKRSGPWVMSCLSVSDVPCWWIDVFGYLSSRDQARLACVLYSNTIDMVDESYHEPCDPSVVVDLLKTINCGIDLPKSIIQNTEDITMREPSIFGSAHKDAVSVSVVVPLHNQAANVERIFRAFGGQTKVPYEYIIVADRCTDTTIAEVIASAHHLRTKMLLVHRNDNDEGFRAGQVRNLGVAHKTQGRVLFIDGDCVPCDTWVEAHMSAMDEAGDDSPVATFGLRKDQVRKDSEEYRNDTRTYRSTTPIFWKEAHSPIVNRGVVYGHMATWSCNLGLNSRAIELLTEMNGSVFSSMLTQGKWGGEDTYLGMQLWDNDGVLIAVSPEAGHVKHIWHARATESALGAESKLTHRRKNTVFLVGDTDLCDTVENNLIRSSAACSVPGLYDLFLPSVMEKSPNRALSARALAYLCSRSTLFERTNSLSLNVAPANDMYSEIIRVKDTMTRSPVSLKVLQGYMYRRDISFDVLSNDRAIRCPKCKTFMRDTGSTHCPMCRQPYAN